jgi:CBS domain containing-hemolysin-like protein
MARNEKITILSVLRPVAFIPETIELQDALQKMQKERNHMTIVVDEYGGISGLLTTEDIIEEIFGEIQDEFDQENPFFQETDDGVSIDARLLIEDVNRYFHLLIVDEDNDTIGGWLFSQFGRVPVIEEQIHYDSVSFMVEKMRKQSIERILVKSAEVTQPIAN